MEDCNWIPNCDGWFRCLPQTKTVGKLRDAVCHQSQEIQMRKISAVCTLIDLTDIIRCSKQKKSQTRKSVENESWLLQLRWEGSKNISREKKIIIVYSIVVELGLWFNKLNGTTPLYKEAMPIINTFFTIHVQNIALLNVFVLLHCSSDSHKISYIVSKLGRSIVDKNLWLVDGEQRLYLFQTHSGL